MTGYGRADVMIDGIKISIEIRSVNHRYHEIMFKMPKDFISLEDKMKKTIQKYMKRGRLDVFVTLDVDNNPNQQLKVDWGLIDQYIEVLKQFKQRYDIEGEVSIKDILTVPDLINVGQEIFELDLIQDDILSTLELATKNLADMRANEGDNLYIDLTTRIASMQDLLLNLQERAPLVVEEYRNKLTTRIKDWLEGEVDIDEARLLNEVAFFTDKANVDEEITRLKSHFQQFLVILEQDEPVGRKLDFLIQEMNREVNTIGSKANDLSLSQTVVNLKSELEKMREQVQNVE